MSVISAYSSQIHAAQNVKAHSSGVPSAAGEELNEWQKLQRGYEGINKIQAFLDYKEMPPIEHYIEEILADVLKARDLTIGEFESLPQEEQEAIMTEVRKMAEDKLKEESGGSLDVLA